ncbi:MAG: hypothetical protein ABJA37_00475 [Ferruginibacter sp.]
MTKKKSAAKKPAKEKTFMIKVAEKIGEIAGEIAVGKDHFMQMAAGAVSSVKAGIHNITEGKKTEPAKSVKKPAKKAIQKSEKPAAAATPKSTVVKKNGVKKTTKKAIKKPVPKVAPPVAKTISKTTAAKKSAVRIVKK